MPSPLAHATMGYVIYRIFNPHLLQPGSPQRNGSDRLLPAAIGISLLPDLDSILGILAGDFGRYHNNLSHSLISGLVVALAIGGLVWSRRRAEFGRWFLFALLCYELHVIMDFFTVGRGVMALWPLTVNRYQPPLKLFYGLHWSEGWFSLQHLWTLITELCFVAVAIMATYLFTTRQAEHKAPDQVVQ